MKNLIIFLFFIGLSLASFAQNDTTRYTMVNGYGFTYNRLKAKAALVTPTDTVQNKLPGSIVILNDTMYVRTNVRWQAVTAGAGLPAGGTTGQILAKNSATNYDVAWIDNYTTDVREYVKASVAVNKGQAVYVSGADGTNVLVSKASNTTEATSSKTLGLMFQNLAQNGQGFVIIQGKLSGLNTLGTNVGDPVWLGTNGNLLYGIANKPVAPANLVYMGVVTRVNANNGEIFVHVQNGFELEELHDVLVTNKQNGQGLVYDSTSALWKNRWVLTDTTSLSNRINLKVNISDTSAMLSPYLRRTDTTAMLSPYLRKADTLTLSNRINLKVNISDTASMLSPYYRTATANAALSTKLNISDTAAMLLPYLRDADTATLSARIDQRVKYTDTSSMLSPYLRRADTTAMLSPYARTATVNAQLLTKVNVSDTSAMLTPYLRKADTTAMLSPYARTATVNASLATKLNISDTSSMLSPYYRTSAATAALATKLNISDTSNMLIPYFRKGDTTAMLNPYLRKADTATLSNRINLKVNISDTSTMLTPYVRAAGYGLTKSGQTLTVDTLNIATRAWRQKGLDSLAAIEISGSGTTNYVSKFTNTREIGNSQIFDNGTNVGIGTASPGVKLDIIGSAGTIARIKGGTGAAQGSAFYQQFAGSANTMSAFGDRANLFGGTVDQIASIFTGGGIPLTFDVNAAERMRITAAGNVGLGTSSPSSVFHVYGPSSGDNIRIQTAGTSALKVFSNNQTSNSFDFAQGFASASDNVGYVWNNANAAMVFGTNATERLRIFANGRVGINTTTDAGYQFDIAGDLRTTTGARLATNSGLVGIGSTSAFYTLDVTGSLRSSADAWFATSSGSAGVGTTSVGSGTKFQVNGGYITVRGVSGGGGGYFTSWPNTTNADARTWGFGATINAFGDFGITQSNAKDGDPFTAGTTRMYFDRLGNVGIGTDAPSERLDVNGRIRIRTIDSTASAMNVLYADATGVIKKASATAFPGGSGTLNYVPKWTAANTLGNSQIFDNGTNVGIGTTSPAGKLVVVGANNNTYLSVDNAASGENYFGANAFHQFQTAGSPRMHINASGNVGIGSTNPLTRLHITSVDSYIASFNTSVTTADTSFLGLGNFSSYQPGTSGVSIASYHNLGASFATDMGLYTHSGASMGERVRITATGNVGIGTSLPAEKLDVVGNVLASNSAGTYPRFISTVGAKSWEIGYRSGTTNYEIREDGNTRMVIANGGNIGLGASSPYYRTHISQPKNTTGLFITNGPSAANDYTQIGFGFDTYNVAGAAIRAIAENPSASFNHHLTFHTYENTLQERMRITPTGNVGIANQNPVNRLHIYTPNRTSLTATGGGINVNYNGSTTGEFSTIGFSWASSINDATRWGMGLTGTNFASGLADLFFFNGGVDRMRISSTGHVGIGVTPSAWSGVSPSLQFGVSPYIASSGQYLYLGSNTYYNGTNSIYTANGAAATYAQSEGTHQFYTAGTGTAGGTATFTERMRIFNNGRVFIGASPTDAGYQLDVNGNTRVTGTMSVTANTSFAHNVQRNSNQEIASQIFNSGGWIISGAEGVNGGAIFTGSTPYAAVVGSGYNRPLQIATNNTVRMEIDSVGLVGINTVNPTERLDVNGRVRIRTVDSTATATNMLYVDNSGVVKKTAVPGNNVSYITTTNTISTGWTFAKDSARNLNHNFINVVLDNTTNEGTATLQMAIYQPTSSFTTGQWVNVASLSSAYTPKTTIIFELPGYVSGTTYYTSGNVQFSGASEYTGTKVVRIDPSGNVDVRIGTVSASATAGGTNYVLIPILATYAIYNVPL